MVKTTLDIKRTRWINTWLHINMRTCTTRKLHIKTKKTTYNKNKTQHTQKKTDVTHKKQYVAHKKT